MQTAQQLRVFCFRAAIPPRHRQLPQRERREGKGQRFPSLLLSESTTPSLLPDLLLSCSAWLIRMLIDIHSRFPLLSTIHLVLPVVSLKVTQVSDTVFSDCCVIISLTAITDLQLLMWNVNKRQVQGTSLFREVEHFVLCFVRRDRIA